MSEEENTNTEINLAEGIVDECEDCKAPEEIEYFEIDKGNIQLHKHTNVDEFPDSIEIGTPSKGGAFKVYGNFDDKKTFEEKIINAMALRKFMQDAYERSLGENK